MWVRKNFFLFGFLISTLSAVADDYNAFERQLIKRNIQLAEGIDSFAEGLDVFLVGKKVSQRENATSVVLNNSSYQSEGQPIKNSTHLDVNLRLPNLEEYWQLRFTSYDENEEDRGVSKTYFRRSPRDENYGASLGFFRQIGKIRTTFRPRVQLSDPLKVSYILRFESQSEQEQFQVKPKIELFAHPDKGTGVFGALNFNYVFSEKWTLTLINESEYQDFSNLYSVSNGLALSQSIDAKNRIVYSEMFFSGSRPAYHLNSIVTTIGWSHVFYRKILEFGLAPYLDFSKVNEFKGRVGFSFNVALIF